LRARDLASQADRRGAALACVVLAPALEGGHAQRDRAAAALQLDAAVDAVVHGLKQTGRSSDAIGRLGRTEFAVLAPDADARGARQLGTRLGRAIARAAAPPETRPPATATRRVSRRARLPPRGARAARSFEAGDLRSPGRGGRRSGRLDPSLQDPPARLGPAQVARHTPARNTAAGTTC